MTYLRLATVATALLTLVVMVRAADVPHNSGGIGSAEREELRAKERDYNVKVVAATKSGDYLSGVELTIDSAAQERILETKMAGPILSQDFRRGHIRSRPPRAGTR